MMDAYSDILALLHAFSSVVFKSLGVGFTFVCLLDALTHLRCGIHFRNYVYAFTL